jgi:hypothetical protein
MSIRTGCSTSINYSAEDKTPQILSDLVTTTVNIAKIAKDLGFGLTTKPYPPFTYTFDPFDSAETNRVKSQLFTRQNLELQISPRPYGARSELGRDINRRVAYHVRAEDPPGGGVFYHPPTTVEMLLIDHNVQKAAEKANTVASAERKAISAAAAALAKPSATPTPSPSATPTGTTSPTPTPSPTPKAKSDQSPAPAPDKTQPTPKPATLCHVVLTVPDVDQVACLPLGRSFLTKRESNLGFAHGMPTTFVFKQPSGMQALTGTLSSITWPSPSASPSAKGPAATARKPVTRFGAPLAAYDSSALVDLRLAATGNAQVLVFLRQDAKPSKTLISRELGKLFSAARESQVASLALASGGRKRPPAFRHFPRLG